MRHLVLSLALLPLCACVSADAAAPEGPAPFCGDGALDAGELCDEGERNGTPGAGCSAGRDGEGACLRDVCGDGVIDEERGELCDDGDASPAGSCGPDCRPLCGNGALDPGEECDPNAEGESPGACTSGCDRVIGCGNGRRDDDELCDPSTGEPGCSSSCAPVCGDGILVGLADEGGERCDAGPSPLPELSSCGADCRPSRCGDRVVEADEACDDGDDSVTCTADCLLKARCSAIDVQLGWWTLFARMQDGTVRGAGGNVLHALGLPDPTDHQPTPAELPFPRFARLSAGERGGAGITPDGRLFTWGADTWGQRGLGAGAPPPLATEVPLPVAALDVAVGYVTTWVVGEDGSLYALGSDFEGSLGLPAAEKATIEQRCSDLVCVTSPRRIGPPDVRFVDVEGFNATAIAIDDLGRLWGFGLAFHGQLGEPGPGHDPQCWPNGLGGFLPCEPAPKLVAPTFTGVTDVAVGSAHTLFVHDGRLWGLGAEEILGLPPAEDGTYRQVRVPVELGAALLHEGERFERVAVGDFWSFAVTTDGRLFGAGGNHNGQLGLGTSSSLEPFRELGVGEPVRAAAGSWGHSAVLLRDGRILTMGFDHPDAPGRLGRPFDASSTLATPIETCR